MNYISIAFFVSALGQGDQSFCLPAYGQRFCTGGLNSLVLKQLFNQNTSQSSSFIFAPTQSVSCHLMSHTLLRFAFRFFSEIAFFAHFLAELIQTFLSKISN